MMNGYSVYELAVRDKVKELIVLGRFSEAKRVGCAFLGANKLRFRERRALFRTIRDWLPVVSGELVDD